MAPKLFIDNEDYRLVFGYLVFVILYQVRGNELEPLTIRGGGW